MEVGERDRYPHTHAPPSVPCALPNHPPTIITSTNAKQTTHRSDSSSGVIFSFLGRAKVELPSLRGALGPGGRKGQRPLQPVRLRISVGVVVWVGGWVGVGVGTVVNTQTNKQTATTASINHSTTLYQSHTLSTARMPSSSPVGVVGGSWARATSSASAKWSRSTRWLLGGLFVGGGFGDGVGREGNE